MRGPDSLEVARLEVALEMRKIDRWPIMVLTCAIVLMNELGLVRCTICWRF